ncbi:MAG: tetratricopeptide repeat protein [Chitinophagales bacterium]|nr:tetratricopeptide repeat protein [Bacteroidota bacterium]MCB9043630.1 tetratricopeptide repeat protein [Chitinophagales bacterium]
MQFTFFKKIGFIVFLLSVFSTINRAENTAERFSAANAAYQEKNYPQAIATYTSLLDSIGDTNALLHYNLANCYYKTDSLPQAILHYEKALKISPNFDAAKQNLALCLDKADLHNSPNFDHNRLRILQTFWQMGTPLLWAILLLIGLYVAAYALWRYWTAISIKTQQKYLLGAIISLLLAGVFAWSSYSRANALFSQKEAIILAANVSLHDGPAENSIVIGAVAAGEKVHFLQKTADWALIQTNSGKTAWVQQKSIGII